MVWKCSCNFSSPLTEDAMTSAIKKYTGQPERDIDNPFTFASSHCSLPSSLHQQLRRGRYLSSSDRPEKVRRSSSTTAGTARSTTNPQDDRPEYLTLVMGFCWAPT